MSPQRRRLNHTALFLFLLASCDEFAYFSVVAGVGKYPPPPLSFWVAAWTSGLSTWGLWVACAAFYARSKGHSPWWGVCGLFTCVGLAPLLLLRARSEDEPAEREPGDYPRPRRKG